MEYDTQDSVYGRDSEIRDDFIPADRYVSQDVVELEKRKLWPRVWQIVCREEELPNAGNFVTYQIADESIVILRAQSGEIKAYYNVCQHRGRRLIDEPAGRIANFYCRYHGWKWDLDGQIQHVYHRNEWDSCPQFTDDSIALKKPKCATWAGWVWINMDPDAEPLETYLEPINSIIEPFDFGALRRAWHVCLRAPVNWKVVIEAFNEGYHSAATHSTRMDYEPMHSPIGVHGRHNQFFTNFAFDNLPEFRDESGAWRKPVSLQEHLYYQMRELNEDLGAMVADPLMKAATRLYRDTPVDMPIEEVFGALWAFHREELEAFGATWPERLTMGDVAKAGASWQVFPNTIFLPNPDAVLWYRVRPDGDNPDSCIFDIWCLRRYPEGKAPLVETAHFDGFEAAKGANTFLEQDFSNMLAVQRGMKSRGWEGARTNPVEEASVVNFHRNLDSYLL